MYGTKTGDSIEIWDDEIKCAIDVRSLNEIFIISIVNAAIKLDCIFVLHDNGELTWPDIGGLMIELENSRAARSLSDPVAFLRGRAGATR